MSKGEEYRGMKMMDRGKRKRITVKVLEMVGGIEDK